jgi:hypothetical protein
MSNLNDREERELRERQLRRDVQVARDSENTTNGLFLGILLAATAGLVTLFFALNQRTPVQLPAQPPQVNVQPPDVNVQVSPQAPAPQVPNPDVNVTIPPVPAPDVNINVPPATEVQPTQPQGQSLPPDQAVPDEAGTSAPVQPAPAGGVPAQP